MPRKAPPASTVAAAGRAEAYLVPRTWLAAGAALVLLPWLVAGTLYLRAARRDGGPAPPPTVPAALGLALGREGRWGRLETHRITISPPLEYVPDDGEPEGARHEWRFPNTSRVDLAAFLAGAGLGPADVDRLLAGARDEPRIDGLVLDAYPDVVSRLSPESRAAVYLQLARSPLNPRYQNAVRFHGTVEEWLGTARVSPQTLGLVRPLVYGDGGFVLFADIDLVRPGIADAAERRRLAKALHRESTLVARVRVPDPARVDEVASYWGAGGRRTDVRPLLESVALLGPESSVDVVHLLPPFARLHLYRYPKVSRADLDKPSLPNCYWTALNFFSAAPDDRYLDLPTVQAALRRDYYLVHDDLQMGDVVVFSAEDGSDYHAAVYLADGLIFGKNGHAPLAPWTILPLERIAGYYPQHAQGRVTYYRRKDL